jgi:hypothetical protein
MKVSNFGVNLSSAYVNSRETKLRITQKDEKNEAGIVKRHKDDDVTRGIKAVSNDSNFLSNKIAFEKDVVAKSLSEVVKFKQNYAKSEKVYIEHTREAEIKFGGDERATGRHQLELNLEHKDKDAVAVEMIGRVQTEDGREIDFDIGLNLSREFVHKHNFDIDIKDPLVINFDRPSVELSDEKFEFDIDADGEIDQISSLKSGSGFLALDKNGDGTINDGKELFGTQGGNGFEELRVYDKDGNGWIDENDSVFESLRVWKKTPTEDKLVALGEAGVGAIYLGYADSPYMLQSTYDGKVNGAIKQTGMFIKESGDVGTVQNVDMVTDQKEVNVIDSLRDSLMPSPKDLVDFSDSLMNATSDVVSEVGGREKITTTRAYELEEIDTSSKVTIKDGKTTAEANASYTKHEEVSARVEEREVVVADKDILEASEKLEKMGKDVSKMMEDKEPKESVIDNMTKDDEAQKLFDTEKNSKISEIKTKTKELEGDISSLEGMKTGESMSDNYIDIQIAKANREIQDLKNEQQAIESQKLVSSANKMIYRPF